MKQTENEFKVPEDFPTPRVFSVLVKKISQGDLITQTGIILPDTVEGNANNNLNSNKPNVGIIYAVGPKCPEDLKPGLRIFYNQYADATILIGTESFIMMHETDVYVILKPKNYVKIAPKTAKEVRRMKGAVKRDFRLKVSKKQDSERKDKIDSLAKKKRK